MGSKLILNDHFIHEAKTESFIPHQFRYQWAERVHLNASKGWKCEWISREFWVSSSDWIPNVHIRLDDSTFFEEVK